MKGKPELLAPAGNLQKLKLAFYFGADAVYVGGKAFSLRTFADNFTDEELKEGIEYAHTRGKKVYVAANIFARNGDFARLKAYFRYLQEIGADAVLISDPGAFRICKEVAPKLPVHLSTQANTTNAQSAAFWKDLGVSRVVLAREISLQEIAEIHAENPHLELEAFVHGAMCISYSGRCLLSDYLDGRSSNRGACVQACRYRYSVRTEEKRADEWFPLEEDEKGAYFMNSKDLNMSAHLADLAKAGVCSFKIEGRMKSEYYLATVVNAYRRMLDEGYSQTLAEELKCAAHRAYTTAYALGENRETVSYDNSQTKGTCEFIAVVKDYQNGRAFAEMRGRFYEGDILEILSPSEQFAKSFAVEHMQDGTGNACTDAKRVQEVYLFDCPYPLQAGDILRRRKEERVHEMQLQDIPFQKIKSGSKTYELRLYDEKRQAIKEGDCIRFTNVQTGESLSARVLALHRFPSFEELYRTLPLDRCGYSPEEAKAASPADMNAYYSEELRKKYGAIAIEISVIS